MTSLSGTDHRNGGVTEIHHSTRFADAADSCSLVTSPVCCRVTLVGCIFLFTGPIVFIKFYFCSISPHLCLTPSTVNVYEAKLVFVSDKFRYLNIMFNNFPIPFFSFYAQTKILLLLVNIGYSC